MGIGKKILVLGGRGLVGSSLVRELHKLSNNEVLAPSRSELDLQNQEKVFDYVKVHRPDQIYLAAAKVGGIKANNDYRADFIFENLEIQNNVFRAAFLNDVQNLLFLGSSCIYPKLSPQPIKEEYLLSGALEPTNEPYAIAKIAGLKLAESFRKQYGKKYLAVMPTNLYGPNDNYDPQKSHVIPGLISRMHKAKLSGDTSFEVWGTGSPRREFLFVDDLARACVLVMNYKGDLPYWINVGTGTDITIRDLAAKIKEVVGYTGEIVFNPNFPDGTPRKLLDVSKMKALGWEPSVDLSRGLEIAYADFLTKSAAQ